MDNLALTEATAAFKAARDRWHATVEHGKTAHPVSERDREEIAGSLAEIRHVVSHLSERVHDEVMPVLTDLSERVHGGLIEVALRKAAELDNRPRMKGFNKLTGEVTYEPRTAATAHERLTGVRPTADGLEFIYGEVG